MLRTAALRRAFRLHGLFRLRDWLAELPGIQPPHPN
jgi:hypothetical protein